MLSSSEIKVLQKEIKKENDGLVKIFKLLVSKPELCVTEIAQIFNISLPASSVQRSQTSNF